MSGMKFFAVAGFSVFGSFYGFGSLNFFLRASWKQLKYKNSHAIEKKMMFTDSWSQTHVLTCSKLSVFFIVKLLSL